MDFATLEISKEDEKLIVNIIKRANAMELFAGDWHALDARMSLMAAHSVEALNLDRLLKSDDESFIHDLYGIDDHVDHETGKLLNCFLPRCG